MGISEIVMLNGCVCVCQCNSIALFAQLQTIRDTAIQIYGMWYRKYEIITFCIYQKSKIH